MSYYSWVFLGLVLIIIEMTTFSMFFLPLGVAALLTALVLYFKLDLMFKTQIIIFIISSLFFLYVMSKSYFIKNLKNKKSIIGQSKSEAIGKIGKVINVNEDNSFEIGFNEQIMGSKIWIGFSDEIIKKDDTVIVNQVMGNQFKVKKE